MKAEIARALRIASRQTDTSPSDDQKAAGNYAKGKFNWHSLTIAIENPKGSERSGASKDGKAWRCKLPSAYGYILGTRAIDNDHVDCYVGPDHDAKTVYVVDQIDSKTGRYDEPKCMLSYANKQAALSDYEKAFSDGRGKDRIGAVTEMPVNAFVAWVKHGDTKKPLGLKGYASGGAVGMANGGQTLARVYSPSGVPFTVAAPYAAQFQAFLADLENSGYKLNADESGGYNNRNIAGTHTPSEHAFGRAIDVNWSDNPRGGTHPSIPADVAQRLAEHYGLTWGGNWKGQTYDPMHFQVDQSHPWSDTPPLYAKADQLSAPIVAPDASGPNNSSIALARSYAPLADTAPEPPMGLGRGPSELPVMQDSDFPGFLSAPVKTSNFTPKSESSNSGGDWVQGPLGLMPKWGDDTPLQPMGLADGGAPEVDDRTYPSDLPATQYAGEDPDLSTFAPPTTGDPMVSRAAMLPWGYTASGKVTGPAWPEMLHSPYEAAKRLFGNDGQEWWNGPDNPQAKEDARNVLFSIYGGSALSHLPSALEMNPSVLNAGARGVGKVFENPEVDERGFISPSLEASKLLPQEKGTVQQFRSMLLDPRYGGKEKELQANQFDRVFPDPNAKVNRGDIEQFLRENRVGLGQTELGDAKRLPNLSVEEKRFGRDAGFNVVSREGGRPEIIAGPFETRAEADAYFSQAASMSNVAGASRYESYSTPGGIPGSYREVVTTLAERGKISLTGLESADELAARRAEFDANNRQFHSENYTSSHWPGITNPVLHYRTKDFPISDSFVSGNPSEQGASSRLLPSNSAEAGRAPYPLDSPSPHHGSGDIAHTSTNPNSGLKQTLPSKVRVLDELQSDWAQRARDQGIMTPDLRAQITGEKEAKEKEFFKLIEQAEPIAAKYGYAREGVAPQPLSVKGALDRAVAAGDPEAAAARDKISQVENDWTSLATKAHAAQKGVPSAPFISGTSDWVDLGLKQALSEAARDPSVTRFAWAPGSVQADRYGMHKVADEVSITKPREDGTRGVQLHGGPGANNFFTVDPNGAVVDSSMHEAIGKPLHDVVGKEWADKLLATEGGDIYDGNNLKVGGYGHKAFYGDFTPEGSYTPGIVGTRLLKLVKSLDPEAANIEAHDFATSTPSGPFARYPSIPITPKLREQLLKGQTLFSTGGGIGLTPDDYGSSGYPASEPDEGSGSVDEYLREHYGDGPLAMASPQGTPPESEWR